MRARTWRIGREERGSGRGVVFWLALGALVGCGAKTGLNAPELVEDAAVDAEVEAPPCFEVPVDAGPVNVALEVEAEIGRADIVLLVDTTLSMDQEIAQIRARLRDLIVPAVRDAIPDSEFAVTTFADFPVRPYGLDGVDLPFRLMVSRTNDITLVQAGVDAIRLGNGLDPPESQVEALYQIATGEGILPYVSPSLGCPHGGIGYPCLRTDALPIILLFTDVDMHNGPGGAHPYNPALLGVAPATFNDAVSVLNDIGAKVIGFDSGTGRRHLEAVARQTNTIDASGRPMVFHIGDRGQRLGPEVVGAIQTLAGSLIQDIDAIPLDPDPGDGIDVLDFVELVRPLSASPASGIREIDVENGVFLGVEAGTRLTFQVVLRNGAVVPGTEPLVLRLEIVFRSDGRNRIGSRIVYIVIPAEDGAGCDELNLSSLP